jgi:hypothetical protein
MTHPNRSFLALSILALVLAACGQTADAPASETPEPSQPTAPSQAPTDPPEAPSEEPSAAPSEEPEAGARDVAGTITVAQMAFSGPGGTIQEALDTAPDGDLPSLVNGVLFRDADGSIYLATRVGDTSAPTFDGPILQVLEMDADGPSWDMANAEMLGLEEANGIVFKQDAQVLGFVELP